MRLESLQAHQALRASGRLAEREQRILAFIRERGTEGATADEVRKGLGARDPNTTAPRITRLAQAGQLIRTAARRGTSSGHTAAVYIAAELAGPRPMRPWRVYTPRGTVVVLATDMEHAWKRLRADAARHGVNRAAVTKIELVREGQQEGLPL